MNFMRAMMIAVVLSVAVGCGSQRDAQSPLAFVPADTPYVIANLEGVPTRVSEPWFALLEPFHALYSRLLADVRNDTASRLGQETGGRLLPLLELLEGRLGAEGLEELGIARDGLIALYGVGTVPVLRAELRDEAAFRRAIEGIQDAAGASISVEEVAGQAYWRVPSRDVSVPELIFAVLSGHVVASLDFGPQGPPLAVLFGLQRPAHSLLASGELETLNAEYGLSPYGTLLIDTRRLAGLLRSPPGRDGVATGIGALLSPACQRELVTVAEALPRVVSGYHRLSSDRAVVRSVIELRSDLAAELEALAAPVPGLGDSSRHPLEFGIGVHPDKLAAFLGNRAAAVAAAPYRCEWLAGLNTDRAALRLAPFYMAAGWFRGFRLIVQELVWEGSEPEELEAALVLASPNPNGLIGLAQGFLPQLAGLDLRPGNEPQPVALGAFGAVLPAVARQPYIAVGEQAIGIAVGEKARAQLNDWLAATGTLPPPMLHVAYDGAVYGRLTDRLDAVAAAVGVKVAPPTSLQQGVDDAVDQLWRSVERVEFDVVATARGLEIREQWILK